MEEKVSIENKKSKKIGGNILKGCLGCLGIFFAISILILVLVLTATKETRNIAKEDIQSLISNVDEVFERYEYIDEDEEFKQALIDLHEQIEKDNITLENSAIKIRGLSTSTSNGIKRSEISGFIAIPSETGGRIEFNMKYERSSKDVEWGLSGFDLGQIVR